MQNSLHIDNGPKNTDKMLKFLINLFGKKTTHNFVVVEDPTCGGYMAYADDYPHVTAIGKTKEAALDQLKKDIEAVKKIEMKLSKEGEQSTIKRKPRDKHQVANA